MFCGILKPQSIAASIAPQLKESEMKTNLPSGSRPSFLAANITALAAAALFVLWGNAFAEKTVVICVIDGLQAVTAKTAAENGAANLKMIYEQGVVAEQAYCPAPGGRMKLEDGSEPWGGTTPPNVAIHTGCHMFESYEMDDIFLAAREKGIASVFSGGHNLYSVVTTPSFHYAGNFTDEKVVQNAIDHYTTDDIRLVRLHLQRIRSAWNGPDDRIDPNSEYVKAVVAADAQLGRLIDEIKAEGDWDSTYLVVSADHGMGETTRSSHPGNVLSSWEVFIGFYGPGIKKGETIPYAENPDIAILAAHLLGLRPLKGHTDPDVTITPRGPTGVLLTNIFEGNPRELGHPKPIYSYLEEVNLQPQNNYVSYRNGVRPHLEETPTSLRNSLSSVTEHRRVDSRIDKNGIHYIIRHDTYVVANIVNAQGSLVSTIHSGHQGSGEYRIGSSQIHAALRTRAAGVYFLRFAAGRLQRHLLRLSYSGITLR